MDNIINIFSGQLFIPLMGLFYLMAKLIIRNYIHKLIMDGGERVDLWPVVAWFGVDLAVLTLTLSITIKAPQMKGYAYQESVVWYVFMGFFIIMSCLFYGTFMKTRKSLSNISPLKSFKLFILLILCIITGAAFFTPTLKAFVP